MTFQRMADRRPVETLVERDDGVVFSMRGAGGGADLPHDLVHALVERELRIHGGIWGSVADGVVWRSMRHVSGRLPPHASERSDRLKRERAARIRSAELVANVVGRLAAGEPVLPGTLVTSEHPREELAGAAAERATARRRWATLPAGETWTLVWERHPATGRRPRTTSRRR